MQKEWGVWLLLFMSAPLWGQHRVYLSSDTLIYVGLNGKTITSTPTQSLAFDWPNDSIMLSIKPLSGDAVERLLHLEPGTSHYVFERVGKGKRKLFYRGEEPEIQTQLLSYSDTLSNWIFTTTVVSSEPKKASPDSIIVSKSDTASFKVEPPLQVIPESSDRWKSLENKLATSKFEFEKLQLLLESSKLGFSVAEISRLGQNLSYETSRLEFLIKAYPNCKDPDHYNQLLSLLEYESSKNQLNQIINENKQ